MNKLPIDNFSNSVTQSSDPEPFVEFDPLIDVVTYTSPGVDEESIEERVAAYLRREFYSHAKGSDVELHVVVTNGKAKISGKTNNLSIYQRVQDVAPRIKDQFKEITSADVSGFKRV